MVVSGIVFGVMQPLVYKLRHSSIVVVVPGVGTGGEAVIIADIARFTSEQERTSVISRLIAIRQTGLLLGNQQNNIKIRLGYIFFDWQYNC